MKKSKIKGSIEKIQKNPDFPHRNGKPVLPLEAIIMAGGKGERLMPLTEETPKPLLNVGGKPIAEYAMKRMIRAGIRDFTFCVNYLGEKIESRFGDGKNQELSIQYVYEDMPRGTIGGVSLKESFKFEDVLIMNGDLLTTINFERFYLKYLDDDADMTIATIPYRVNLPYGIFELDGEGNILSLKEKPNYTYHINAGIYLANLDALGMIPEEGSHDAIDLIENVKAAGFKVTTFPLLDYWIDIGQVEDYEKACKDIEFLDI